MAATVLGKRQRGAIEVQGNKSPFDHQVALSTVLAELTLKPVPVRSSSGRKQARSGAPQICQDSAEPPVPSTRQLRSRTIHENDLQQENDIDWKRSASDNVPSKHNAHDSHVYSSKKINSHFRNSKFINGRSCCGKANFLLGRETDFFPR